MYLIPNILPQDGDVNYFSAILSSTECDYYFMNLLENIEWKPDEAIILGKHIYTKRHVAWYADSPFSYTYSKITKQASPWTQELVELKLLIEKITGENFNSCLLNLYHDGSEGMAWHSDNEKDLRKEGAIASLTLGAERKFCFKHKKTAQKVSLVLHNGSLLMMRGLTQVNWLHRLPPTKIVKGQRINLTFRQIVI